MADIVDFPLSTLLPTEIGLNFAWQTRDGGAGLNGVTQIISPLSGLWEISVAFIINNRARAQAYRAIKMRMQGRYGWVRLPICDPYRLSFAETGWPSGAVPWSDGSPFSDSSLWSTSQITTVSGAGSLGDEYISLEVSSLGDTLETGHLISINDYLYLTTGVLNEMDVNGYKTFAIGPPLREDVTLGTDVKVGRPTVLCRLADDRSGALSMKFGRWGEPSMEFVEVLERE